ncbi:hypothetical protein GSI_03763 [Ganoderma sinense ZZ0214-1]|uniref:Uncharacterized protein n=1 Tax=Ganoderma sinense ZZ0214-1 TaxID=1077348 RepID=A0A2G8SJW5_9APHY|nr:hypothetical protein GSI_03763 [Ganoderma sinense ZZ0214-1]
MAPAQAWSDIHPSKSLQLVLPDPPAFWSSHHWNQKLPPSWQQSYYIHEDTAPPYSPMDTDDWVSEPDVDEEPPQMLMVETATRVHCSQLTCLHLGLFPDNIRTRITTLLKELPRLTNLVVVADRNPSSPASLPAIQVYDEGEEPDDTDALDPPDILHDVCTALQSVQYGWRHQDAPLLCPELAHLGIIFPDGQEAPSTVSLHALGSMMLFRLREGSPLETLTVEAVAAAASNSAAEEDAEGGSAGVEAEALHCYRSDIHIPPSTLGWSLDDIGELDDAPRAVVGVEDTIHNLVGSYLVERLRTPPEPWFRFAGPDSESPDCHEDGDGDGEDDAVPRSRVFPPGVETAVYRFVYPPSVGFAWSGRS